MRKYAFAAIAAVMFAIPCVSAAGSDGSTALGFTRVNYDPASAGMGGAGVVNASAYSSFRNAAALTYWDKKFDVGASYQGYSGFDTQNISLGAAYRFGKFAVAVGGKYGFQDEYDITDAYGGVNGTFKPTEYQVNLGLAWKFLPFLSIGADVKYLSDQIASGQTNGALSVDAFLMTKIADFRIAAGISSVGTKVKSVSGAKYSLPTSVTVGGGYDHEFGKHGVNVAVDLDYYLNSDFTAAVGAQYSYKNMVFVRAGYHYADDSAVIPSFASVGVGVKFIGIRLDVAYQLATSGGSGLKDTLTAGLGFTF